MFFAIRGMAEAPVESLKTQGFGWVMDLTLADPYYALPLVTSLTLHLMLRMNADGINLDIAPSVIKTFIQLLPVITFFPMTQFPAVSFLVQVL